MGQKGSTSRHAQQKANPALSQRTRGAPCPPQNATPQPPVGQPYSYMNNFSSTIDKTVTSIGGKLDDEIDMLDKKLGQDARTIAESLLMGLCQVQKGRYGAMGIVNQGSFHEGIKFKTSNQFNFMITLEDVSTAIREVKDAAQPGYVDIKIQQVNASIKETNDVLLSLSSGQGAFWEDLKTVISTVRLPQYWSLRTDELLGSNMCVHGPSASILFNVTIPAMPKPLPVVIDIAVGVPIPPSHFPSQIDLLQRLPYEHPLYSIVATCVKESELYAVVKDGKWRLSFTGLERFLVGNMPAVTKRGYLMLKAFRDSHATTVFKMGTIPQHCTSSFVLKTIFLQELLTFPESDHWKHAEGVEPNPPHTRDFMADRLMGMIMRWSKALKSGKLPHLFISTANVLNPGADYEDDDDFLDIQLNNSFKGSVPELCTHVSDLQQRIDSLQSLEKYQLPLAGSRYANTTTVVPWMFLEENFVQGKIYRYANRTISV